MFGTNFIVIIAVKNLIVVDQASKQAMNLFSNWISCFAKDP